MTTRTLPTLRQLLVKPPFTDLETIPPDCRKCTLCQAQLYTVTIPPCTERPVILPCSHIFGETCMRKWLPVHNDCPCCRSKIYLRFEEIGQPELPDEDEIEWNGVVVHRKDSVNVSRIIAIQEGECDAHNDCDEETEATCNKYWRDLADARAELFMRGWLNVDAKRDYDFYLRDPKKRLNYVQPDLHTVKADDLIPHLEHGWESLFIQSYHFVDSAATDTTRHDSGVANGNSDSKETTTTPSKGRKLKLDAAAHPISAPVLSTMKDKLRELDGTEKTAIQLERALHRAFTTHPMNVKLRRLQVDGEEPKGFYIYQGQLAEIVLRRFLGLWVECTGTIKAPKGWINRHC